MKYNDRVAPRVFTPLRIPNSDSFRRKIQGSVQETKVSLTRIRGPFIFSRLTRNQLFMRTMIKDLSDKKGETTVIKGWVDVARHQGKMAFFDFRDVSGRVQGVVFGKPEVLEVAKTLRPEWVVSVEGIVNERPENMIKKDVLNGDIELEITHIEILNEAEIPFELQEDVNLVTNLDHRPFTLRSDKNKAIFKVQHEIIKAFRSSLESKGFTEFQAPKIVGGDAEGGGEVYEVPYFGHVAGLATSPQLYKQMMVAVFERGFTTGNVFRAEKHNTSRHLNEYTSLDYEFGFINDHQDVMDVHESVLRDIVNSVVNNCREELRLHEVEAPLLPEGKFPTLKLREAQELLEANFDTKAVGEDDLEPEHERMLCEYSAREWSSDFVFVTHYPVSKRPFYTKEDEQDPGFTKSFDCLYRGVEITTGGQRRDNVAEMTAGLEMKGLKAENFSFYLEAFATGMPPHGGIGMGLERLTQKFMGLDNVKKATTFPREINRIDTLLSE